MVSISYGVDLITRLLMTGVGAWTEWTDWTDRDGFMDGFKKVDVSVHTSMCDGRMGRIWTDTSIKNGRIKDELFA